MSINGDVWVSMLFRKGALLGTNLVDFNSFLLSCMVRNYNRAIVELICKCVENIGEPGDEARG